MRKFFVYSLAMLLASASFSQTNTFPSNGNVGIGTTTPTRKLDVIGSIRVTDTVFTSGVVISNQMVTDTATVGVIQTGGTVTVGGNLGLGTLNPNTRLDVSGDANVSGTVFSTKVTTSRIGPLSGDSIIHLFDSTIDIFTFGRINNSNTSGPKGISIGHNTVGIGPDCIALGNGVWSGSASVSNAVYIGSKPSNLGHVLFNIPNSFGVGFNSDLPTLFIGPAGGSGQLGKVGIGNTTPGDLFQVGRNAYSISIGELNSNPTLHFAFTYLGFNVSHQSNSWITSSDGANSGGVVMYSNTAGNLYFSSLHNSGALGGSFTDNDIVQNSYMVLYSDDPSLNPPQYRLTVNGAIRTKELIVESGWADYVLYPSHKRMNYLEKEIFINEFHHLPSIADGTTIEKNGLGVRAALKGLAINVEENTLDVIELYKIVLELKKENQNLKDRVELLEKK